MSASSTPCGRTRARASLYLDGVLRAEVRAQVQDHLRACPDCLALFRQTLELARGARELPRRAAPSDLADRVRGELARRRAGALAESGRAPIDPRVRLAAAVALVVVTAAIAFALGRWSAPAPSPPVSTPAAADPPHDDTPIDPRPAPPAPTPPRYAPPPIEAVPAHAPRRQR